MNNIYNCNFEHVNYYNNSDNLCNINDCNHMWQFSCCQCGIHQIVDLKNEKHVYLIAWTKNETGIKSRLNQFAFKCKNCLKLSYNGQIKNDLKHFKKTKPLYIYPSLTDEEIKLLKILENKNEPEITKLITLIKEFFLLIKIQAETKNFKTSATLLSRKILMQFAISQGYKEEDFKISVKNEIQKLSKENDSSDRLEYLNKLLRKNSDFLRYTEFIKNSGILSNKYKKLLKKIRKFANDENHKSEIINDEDFALLKDIMEQLIKGLE